MNMFASVLMLVCIKGIYDFGMTFLYPIIHLNKFVYENVILLLSFKMIKIYIIFVISLVSLKQ